MQVIPEVVQKVTEKAQLIISYNGKPISNGEELTPSETQVYHFAATFTGCCLAEHHQCCRCTAFRAGASLVSQRCTCIMGESICMV